MIAQWFQAFLLTFGVEVLVASGLLDLRAPLWRRVGIILFAQLATHPLVWFVWPSLASSRLGFLVIAETWAVVAELFLYRLALPENSWTRALAVSALANGASFTVGLLAF